jgi:phage terminase small subunit
VKLTPKEEAFCLAIVEGLSKSDAYRKAYKPQRAKPKTIHEKASRIMARGKVRARVAELMEPVIAQTQMTRTEWLQRLARCCRFDPRKMFDAHGKPIPITELEENEAAAIEQYELHAEIPTVDHCRKAFRVKIKFLDRLSALALLGEACHWYADHRQEPGGLNGGPIQKNIIVRFVKPPKSPEEAYRRMVTDH